MDSTNFTDRSETSIALAPPSKARASSAPSAVASVSRLHQMVQVFMACILMFVTGATFALGVFTVPIEQYVPAATVSDPAAAAVSASPVQGAWPFGMGLMHLLSAPVLIVTGFMLDASRASSNTLTLRITALVAALSFALLAIGAAGVSVGSRVLVVMALAFQSIPLGVFYPLVTEHLFAWMPNTPAAAAALSQLAFGAGSILVAWMFNVLIGNAGVVRAIIFSSASMVIATALPAAMLEWPKVNSDEDGAVSAYSDAASIVSMESERAGLLNAAHATASYSRDDRAALSDNPEEEDDEERHLPWNELVRNFRFWLYILAVLSAGVSYAFIPYYFKLGGAFEVSTSTLLMSFQVTGVAATIFGIASALLTDVLAFPSIPALSSGPKNVMLLFLGLQAGLCICLIWISAAHLFVPFVIVVAVMKMVMAAHAGCAALIARDLFGARNSCLVFGIGGGLALGGGEGLSAWIMAAVDARAGAHPTPQSYDAFYWGAAAWSAAGFIALLALSKWPHGGRRRNSVGNCRSRTDEYFV